MAAYNPETVEVNINPHEVHPRYRGVEGIIEPALKDKVAVITGAGSGLGRGMARGLAYAGARIGVLDIVKDRVYTVCSELDEWFGKGTSFPMVASVTDQDALRGAYDSLYTQYGRLDILVNNASVGLQKHIENLTMQDITRVTELNIGGYLLNIGLASDYMTRGREPTEIDRFIINISSVSARFDSADSVLYGLTKAAELALTKTAANRYAPKKIAVNAILPGDLFGDADLVSEVWNPRYFFSKARANHVIELDDPRALEDGTLKQGEALSEEETERVRQIYIGRTLLKERLRYRDVIHQIITFCTDQTHMSGESVVINCGHITSSSR